MSSNLLRSATTVILVLSSLSSAIALVLDTEGEPLRNGGQYYIIPRSIGIGGGLSLTSKNETSPCPFYITRDKDETSPGIPVTISSPFRIAVITTSLPVGIVFEATVDICIQSMGWQVIPDETSGQSYIATGGSSGGFTPTETFSIVESGENNEYKIKHPAQDKDVGIFAEDGLLGITDDIPLPVVFKKAFNVIAMKV